MKTAKTITNKTWAQLQVGDTASIERTCSDRDLLLFAHVSGNTNPLMLPLVEGEKATEAPIAPSMWVGSLISAVLGNILPGPGTLYIEQNFQFPHRVHVGDKLRVTVTCKEKRAEPVVVFDTVVVNGKGESVCKGLAVVSAPTRNVETPVRELPALILEEKEQFPHLINLAAQLPRLKTVVVCPEDHNSLGGPLLAFERGLIEPIFIGDPERIAAAARELDADISQFKLVEEKDHRAAADKAVAMVRAGEAGAVMKGDIHSDDLLAAVVKKDGGLRAGRRISHVFVLDTLTLDDLLFVSDAAINIAPDLLTKVDIVQNAIDLALACGVDPKVGVLSAVEVINPAIASTLDAAILSKMAERGQIRGGVVDGPLAMDNAIDVDAARTKGIASLVAGHANVLIAPNLESGNMLAKELTFVAHAEAAGLVVGASAPVMLTSRADNEKARLVSCALAQLYAYWRQHGRAFTGAASDEALAAE
ncbi:bifunctional enoyl-CoA hydratase/phosphate acetyltransferase [Rhodoblastus acidophilus]|uniref:Bifunctional enoyl-CoA hydratase/phosphate acetyltransferase n=1 Tax=Candidatus Rhodoblastus alkanivorans TaxID=2954117 RepID=A0ABS9ZB91_9HYPH|nr:bifunctional enoyl-CoA hydratase/phosphate acetyltransferase [Candidatus Rhodoblastus alkanivorans]MCI4677248.1 bifunctional enoyl-CoA hydratase/phosphate acetyltransferase [Candidatus Rhodoblastus alkanivorans]MCI4684600.1 bifunctional enoyl-CoA hydratase/phosphate acetyltransferase [Candidatus Rhodoblastus alkanivorans]MDI4641922.1 bifunctional enoyl-CoA hydratase/phosphate acetyltransferase [Rhodoblastus acidophilus]